MKKIAINFFLFSILIFVSNNLLAQAYSIKGNIAGLKDTSIFLGYHYADKQYLKDTTEIDNKGNFVFKGDKKLDGGIYLIVTPDKRYCEVLLADDQDFSFTTDLKDMVMNMKVTGSTENELFYTYLSTVSKMAKDIEPMKREMDSETTKAEKKEELKKQIELKEKEIGAFRKDFIAKHKGTFVSKLFLAMEDPEIPEAPKGPDGKPLDSLFSFKYYRQHFFDNIDFTDDKILRSPVYHNKVKMYFEKLTYQIPDSIKKAADFVVEKSRANKELFKYTVWYLTTTYEQSKIMGFDAVFVHMVDEVYAKNEAFWMDSTQLDKIVKRANDIRPTLLGNKATNLTMVDTANRIVNLYSVKAPVTLLYFWASDCGHCKKETPKVVEVYNKYKKHGVKVFSINTKRDVSEWKKFIKEKEIEDWINVYDPTGQSRFHDFYDIYSTPVLYILDKDKKIVAKRIDSEGLDQFLKREFEMNDKAPTGNK